MNIRDKIKLLPSNPGIYQFLDKDGTIIYVGKAKNLKNRVNSYFNKNIHDSGKTRVMVKKICDMEFIVVDSELDALLLENNLIKKYKPRYNVLLKDDKTYPWICVKNENYPRVFPTRNKIPDGSQYFGPYASVKMMYTLLSLLRQLYPLRTCSLDLSRENIEKKKYKVCLEYHIGNCLGPCEDLVSEAEYQTQIDNIIHIIKGNTATVQKHLKELMHKYAAELEFEKAQLIKEKADLISNYKSKSTIVSPTINNVDVFSVVSDDRYGYVNFMKVVNGAVIQGHTLEIKKNLDETDAELLEIGITELRSNIDQSAKEIIVPFKPEFSLPEVRFLIPQRGDKKKLLEFSERNAKYYMLDKHRQEKVIDPERHTKRILEQMKKDLRLSEIPVHIECFDNSNIQGTNPVAACVVFKNAKPSKKDYRHFNIKTVEGPDDFASMTEVVYRRYKRLKEENEPLPQLIVIDGGKGQLSAALESLDALGLRGKIAIIGIAKRLEEIYYPGDSFPMYIDKKSETLKIIQQLRNEAHRFGITHHRNRRSKGAIKTELTEIAGIGKAISEKLLREFKSVKNIKLATKQEIIAKIGKAKGELVYNHFNRENQES